MKLQVKNIKKNFGDKEILHGINFEVSSGVALGLLGRNGAGKTTTMRILMDVFHANSGEIILDGRKFEPSKQRIGYLPEERGLYPKRKVSDQMIYLGKLRGLSILEAKKNMKKWLSRLEVEEYENRKLETLSKGNQQKIQLASTLISDPDIVILDEPFSGLDPVNSQILKDVVNELIYDNRLVIFSSHQMSYVEEFCDDIAIVDQGRVVLAGKLKEIKKEYGRNSLILSAENMSLQDLQKYLDEHLGDILKVEGKTKQFLILQALAQTEKKAILRRLSETNIDVEHFGRYEPSLNDIFVEKVGDEA